MHKYLFGAILPKAAKQSIVIQGKQKSSSVQKRIKNTSLPADFVSSKSEMRFWRRTHREICGPPGVPKMYQNCAGRREQKSGTGFSKNQKIQMNLSGFIQGLASGFLLRCINTWNGLNLAPGKKTIAFQEKLS